jgi:3-mercaptopyruvate sulfurtransferase SseA
MRSLISLSIAVLFALAALPVGVAGQSRKSRAKARTSIITIESQSDGVRRITPAEARTAFERGRAIIVDVRGEDSYKAGHIKGARWINLNDIGSRAGELPRDKMIITYCS